MAEELPGIPITAVPATASPNSDLPSDPFASLQRVAVVDTVGPSPGGANRQETALEKRDETLRTAVNACAAALNLIDAYYLRRDGTTQQDSVAGVEGNMPMNGHIQTGLGDGSNPTDSTAYHQLTDVHTSLSAAISAVSAALANYALISSVPAVTEITTTSTYTNSSGADQLVLLSACGAGGGGASDDHGGSGGGAGGALVSVPIRLSAGDTIAVTIGAGGAGGSSAGGGAGGATTITIASANYPGGSMVLTLNGGAGGGNTGGAGGTVTWVAFNSSTTVNTPFPSGITGGAGTTGTGAGHGVHTWASGGASALAFNYGGSDAPTAGLLGAGGGGGDAGSAGGNGYACIVAAPRA